MSRIVMTIAAFTNKQKFLLVNKLDLNLRNKRLKCFIWKLLKYYNWSVALYGTEIWTLRKPERVNKWPNSMTDIQVWWWSWCMLAVGCVVFHMLVYVW